MLLPQALCRRWNAHKHTRKTAECTHCCTQTHHCTHTNAFFFYFISAHSWTLTYHVHSVTPQTCTQKHTCTSPHTAHPTTTSTTTTPGWTTSAYPSLPLAWLLASSWLHCHNVILPASQSAITKMYSDNQDLFIYFFFFYTGPFPHISVGPVGHNDVVSSSKAAGSIPVVWDKTKHDGSYFCIVKKIIDYLLLATLGPTRMWDICPFCPPPWLCSGISAFSYSNISFFILLHSLSVL